MNKHEAKGDFSLIPRPSHELTAPLIGRSRILGEMVEETLAFGREEAFAKAARFKIGDYSWCDPDYRQILLWAEALKMDSLLVIEKLVAGKDPHGVATQFQDGRMLSLSWNLAELPLLDFCEGLTVQELRLYRQVGGEPKQSEIGKISLTVPTLRLLHCGYGRLQFLSLSGIAHLTELWCFTNELTDLNLFQVPKLTKLLCSGNQLTKLDLSHVPSLVELSCSCNPLMELDLCYVPNLKELSCMKNQLRKLNLCHIPNLTKLRCSQNQLTELDLPKVPNLTELWCGDNQLRELDLSRVPHLTELWCGDNQLRELDLSCVPHLTELSCIRNQLRELDIRALRKLTKLYYDSGKTRLIQRPDQSF